MPLFFHADSPFSDGTIIDLEKITYVSFGATNAEGAIEVYFRFDGLNDLTMLLKPQGVKDLFAELQPK